MRLNEENFIEAGAEDIKPDYVDVVVANAVSEHNEDAGAHSDIRRLILETGAFYDSAKQNVEGVAKSALESKDKCAESADMAQQAADVAGKARDEAVSAREMAVTSALRYPYIGGDGYWWVWKADIQMFKKTEIKAQGEPGIDGYNPERGVDYWTESDKEEIKAYVNETILDSWEVPV